MDLRRSPCVRRFRDAAGAPKLARSLRSETYAMTGSEPDDLGGAHDGVVPGDGVPGDSLVVEGAVVAVRVAVRAAEELPAAAAEAREPDALPAALAPVDGRLRR